MEAAATIQRSAVTELPRDSAAAQALRVGGITRLSATDWPGQLSAVVFCQGCPWRCGYCHNPHLIPGRGTAEIAWADVLAFLRRRIGLLDAVVFSGGEPLAQTALAGAMRAVKGMGFRVGLHTGGANPSRLAEVLPLVDWVGFDVKTLFADYETITGVRGSGAKAQTSTRLVLDSGVAYEFRTTVHPRQLDATTLARLAGVLSDLGVRNYALQEFRRDGCADEALVRDVPPSSLTASWSAPIASQFAQFEVRRA
jgi:pyruvate formate lyase activating enzyme